MKLIDTHAHLTFEGLIEGVDAVVDRAREAGVSEIVTVATEPKDFHGVLDLCRGFSNVYGATGIHPHYAKETSEQNIRDLRYLCENEYIIAIGETGLDYHYQFSKKDAQVELFGRHLDIASEIDKPVLIHSREAMDETVEILDQYEGKLKAVVFHCFSGTAEEAKMLLDRGYYISFTGVVTFKNAETARQAAKVVPVERMMLETDCPFMSPVPMRKQKINEPALMVHTAKFIAELKDMDVEEFCDAVTETSLKFFGI